MSDPISMPYALTIAGSDPSGGAGVQIDLEVFRRCGVKGLSVITSVSAQTDQKFLAVYGLPKKIVFQQYKILTDSYPIQAIKTGLFLRKDIVSLFLKRIGRQENVQLVIDPLMVSSTGASLLQLKAYKELNRLISIAHVVTPNLGEASSLAGFRVHNLETMKMAAQEIYAGGCLNVIIKGGHLDGRPLDLLYDGSQFTPFERDRISGVRFHGLGCRFSAALTAYLAKGSSVRAAFLAAEDLMTSMIQELSNVR